MNREGVAPVIEALKKCYPQARYYLSFSNPLELMVAAILSAQVRDERVNAVTPKLFQRFTKAEGYARADREELIRYLPGITFAGAKARHIQEACQILVERYGGKVPDTMEALVALPGIARKTAHAILINGFGKVEGIPCDTHVLRLSFRLGWTRNTKPDKVEADLMREVDRQDWGKLAYWLKAHGRAVCQAPVPLCSQCFLEVLCPKKGVTESK